MKTPKIADKVRFWEEQDRINKELIPRVLKQHELFTAHVEYHSHADLEARAEIKALRESTATAIGSAKRQSLVISFVSIAVAVVAVVAALA